MPGSGRFRMVVSPKGRGLGARGSAPSSAAGLVPGSDPPKPTVSGAEGGAPSAHYLSKDLAHLHFLFNF